jgi:hypothetical protein
VRIVSIRPRSGTDRATMKNDLSERAESAFSTVRSVPFVRKSLTNNLTHSSTNPPKPGLPGRKIGMILTGSLIRAVKRSVCVDSDGDDQLRWINRLD